MKRGFTLVEIMVVVITIGILAAIVTVGYVKYQEKAALEQSKTTAFLMIAAAESYRNQNYEYPAPSILSSQSTTGNPPNDDYQMMSSVLGMQADALKSSVTQLTPCTGANCTLTAANTKKIFYITKSEPAGTPQSVTSDRFGGSSPGGTCSYTFPASAEPNQDYMIALWNETEFYWNIERSSDKITTSDGFWCAFHGLK